MRGACRGAPFDKTGVFGEGNRLPESGGGREGLEIRGKVRPDASRLKVGAGATWEERFAGKGQSLSPRGRVKQPRLD